MNFNTSLQAPKAPSEQLCIDSFRILAKLSLILEFKPWLQLVTAKQPVKILWECFTLVAPLSTLLSLLGSPVPPGWRSEPDLSVYDRITLLNDVVQRIHTLEVQGRIPYGEVLRGDDLFGGTNVGFAKVLRTVQRLLTTLESSYPGIFVLPKDSYQRRWYFIRELLDTERAHVSSLKSIGESLAKIPDASDASVECFFVNHSRLSQYHDDALRALERMDANHSLEDWDAVFQFNNNEVRVTILSAYRSICANFLTLSEYLDSRNIFIAELSLIPARISKYIACLQEILRSTLPTECTFYDALCTAIFRFQDIFDNLVEMSWQIRTMRSTCLLQERAEIDTSEFGALVLDDRFQHFSVFLFESMLLCCLDAREVEEIGWELLYPIQPWELGPALRGRKGKLNVVHAFPTKYLKVLRYGEYDIEFELEWTDGDDVRVHHRSLRFTSHCEAQNEQWCSTLQSLVPSIVVPLEEDESYEYDADEYGEYPLSEDEDNDGRRKCHPRPWSLIARKGPRSESSSFIQQELVIKTRVEEDFMLSPGLLPSLFHPLDTIPALSIDTALFTQVNVFSEVSPEELCAQRNHRTDDPTESSISDVVLDLTGQILKDSRYAEAYGGFADVWKCNWNSRKVAVKVLRSGVDDPDIEAKMNKRLARELDVWRRLSHPHILPLYGMTSDFGRCKAMVCPWVENGSVNKYLERCGDILSMTDRLQLLCEVAEGLSYLHSFGVVHGDLTGSNILINGTGHACVCDFGLSSVIAELQGASLTSSIGGAIRWADASLYRSLSGANGDVGSVSVSTWSDIYSFGSVMLEILSGRIPYHYIRSDAEVVIKLYNGQKPRRPAALFVTDAQWEFIEWCWSDVLVERPDIKTVCTSVQSLFRSSLDFRRHSMDAQMAQ